MWDKIKFFGWTTKRISAQPVQRDISVTLTNGDRTETIQRSPSGTKMASSSSANPKRGLEDDESSEGSTSLNFGFKTATSTRRNSSFSFSREPLDLPTWSNVTSPGFTSRLVQQASGHSPLKEFNDSMSHSPFRKSPHKDLTLGELPYVNYSRKPKFSPPSFSSPNISFRTGASSTIYNRDRRKHARQGQTFVRITPIDASARANISITRKSTSPTGPFPTRGSPRVVNEQYRNEGLGGIPQQELAMRFNRLWPHPPGSPVPWPGRPSSPTSPSNIIEALTAGRKRTREPDTFYPPNATPPSMSPPTKISVGIGDTPVRPQMPKRVKFVGGPEGHDRPMMVPYSGIGNGDGEPLSSESILEQMNQTEKRFLPDSTSTPYSLQKKPIRMSGPSTSEEQASNSMRKRRSQTNLMSVLEDEPRSEKIGRLCSCNDCYAEAAGLTINSQPGSPNKSMSSNQSDEKGTNTGEGKSKETCDKGVSTDADPGEFFRGVFRQADRLRKLTSEDREDRDGIMKLGKTVYTKEMYDKDKRKRVERYYRMLKLNPKEDNTLDSTQGESSSSASTNATSVSTAASHLSGGVGGSTAGSGFQFGSPAPPTNGGGFSFGKQTSPIAQTVTTNACSTITSPSSTGISFGSGSSGVSSTAAMPSGSGNSFGSGGIRLPTAVPTASLSTPSNPLSDNNGTGFNANSSLGGQVTFSSGLSSLAKPNPAGIAPATSAENNAGSAQGGFSFSGSAPAFGQPIATSSSASITGSTPAPSTTATAAPTQPSSFSGFGSPAGAPPPFGSGISSTTGIARPSVATTSAPAPPAFGSGSGEFSFGKPIPSAVPAPVVTSAPATTPPPPPYSSGSATTTTQPSMFGQTQAASLFSARGDATDSKSETAGGFSFSAGTATPSTAVTTTASATPAFGAGAGSGSVFGQQANTTTSNTAFGSTFGSETTAPSTGFSFGNNNSNSAATISSPASTTTTGSTFGAGPGSNIFGATAAPTSAPATTAMPAFGQSAASTTGSAFGGGGAQSLGAGGFTFSGIPNPLASSASKPITTPSTTSGTTFGALPSSATSPAPMFGNTAPGNSSASGSSIFGQSNTTSFGSTFGTPSAGAPALSAGGFSFNKTTPASTTTSGSTFSAAAPPAFGSAAGTPTQAVSPFGQSGTSGPFGSSSTTSTPSSGGSRGFNFASVPNPLAGKTTTAAPAPTFGSFGGTAATTASSTPSFGSIAPTSPSSGFGAASTTTNSGFGFGASTMSPSSSGGFGFGGGANPQPPAPSAPSGGFAFGQSTPAPAPAAAPSPAGVFQFGQQANAGATPGSGSPFQFGQQAPQGVPGFSFASNPFQTFNAMDTEDVEMVEEEGETEVLGMPVKYGNKVQTKYKNGVKYSKGVGYVHSQYEKTNILAQSATDSKGHGSSMVHKQRVSNDGSRSEFTQMRFGDLNKDSNGRDRACCTVTCIGSNTVPILERLTPILSGFNFAAAAPAGGPPMFNMLNASTAPRRRDIRRRHR